MVEAGRSASIAEFMVRLRLKVNRKPHLSCLAMDTSTITACANDYIANIYLKILMRYLAGDLLIAITTSGNSENILS